MKLGRVEVEGVGWFGSLKDALRCYERIQKHEQRLVVERHERNRRAAAVEARNARLLSMMTITPYRAQMFIDDAAFRSAASSIGDFAATYLERLMRQARRRLDPMRR